MSRHRNTRCAAIEEDLDAAHGDYDDDYLDDYDDLDERRIDPNDGGAYTKSEFRECYGGTDEWDEAETEQNYKKRLMTDAISIEKEFHRAVLNTRGKLETVHKVDIIIPKDSETSTAITVSGLREDVERAISDIKSIAQEQTRKKLISAKRDDRSLGLAATQDLLSEWPTLNTQVPVTVTFEIDQSVHPTLLRNLNEINKRFNYGKEDPAKYALDGTLIGDTFLCIPPSHEQSTSVIISGPSSKVKTAVTTLNGFLNHHKIMSHVRKVTRSEDQESDEKKEKKKKKSKKEREKEKEEKEKEEKEEVHTPKGVDTTTSAGAGRGGPAGRGEPMGRGEPPSGRGDGVAPSGRGEGVPQTSGRGEGVAQAPSGRGEGVPQTSSGRGESIPSGRGETIQPPVKSEPSSSASEPTAPLPSGGRGVATATPSPADSSGRGTTATAGRGVSSELGFSIPQGRGTGRGAGRGDTAPVPTSSSETLFPKAEELESGTHEVLEQRSRRRAAK